MTIKGAKNRKNKIFHILAIKYIYMNLLLLNYMFISSIYHQSNNLYPNYNCKRSTSYLNKFIKKISRVKKICSSFFCSRFHMQAYLTNNKLSFMEFVQSISHFGFFIQNSENIYNPHLYSKLA